MKMHHFLALLLVPFLLVACTDNPVSHDDHEDEYTAELSFSSEHISTLTSIEIEAELFDDHGEPVSGIIGVSLEYRQVGDVDWRSKDLEVHGEHYAVDFMFYSSGNYEMRVTLQDSDTSSPEILYTLPEPLEVERIHKEVGDYVIAFESFPGHIHEGDTTEVRFYVTDGHNAGMMAAGLVGQMHFTDPDQTTAMSHDAHEHDAGVYEAEHLFAEAGMSSVEFHFASDHGEVMAQFDVPVANLH